MQAKDMNHFMLNVDLNVFLEQAEKISGSAELQPGLHYKYIKHCSAEGKCWGLLLSLPNAGHPKGNYHEKKENSPKICYNAIFIMMYFNLHPDVEQQHLPSLELSSCHSDKQKIGLVTICLNAL